MTNRILKTGKMEIMLKEINEAGGIEASAIASRDGLLICTTLSDQYQAEIFVAMSATMIGAAEAVSTELGKGIPERIIVETQTGKIIGTGAGPKALLLVMTGPDANLGFILFEMKKTSEKIRHLLG